MQADIYWDLDHSSQYHSREWDDGITLFLEGENSVFLISPFAVYLLSKFNQGQQSFSGLLDLVCTDYPDDSKDTLSRHLENTLVGLSQRGILVRTRL